MDACASAVDHSTPLLGERRLLQFLDLMGVIIGQLNVVHHFFIKDEEPIPIPYHPTTPSASATAGDGNRGPQNCYCWSSLWRQFYFSYCGKMQEEKPQPVVVTSPQPVSRFSWRYNSQRFVVSNGVWRTSQIGWHGISATITSIVPLKGERGMLHEGLVACLKFCVKGGVKPGHCGGVKVGHS